MLRSGYREANICTVLFNLWNYNYVVESSRNKKVLE